MFISRGTLDRSNLIYLDLWPQMGHIPVNFRSGDSRLGMMQPSKFFGIAQKHDINGEVSRKQ